MRTVEVKTSKVYSVLIGGGALDRLGEETKKVLNADKVLIVTDSNVKPLYLERAVRSLSGAGFDTYEFVFEAGEKSKTAKTYLEIIDCLGANGFKRTDAVVALGGGVVGDIAGFAAATYMRGIGVIQVPTSLLAMIDSSVGGKTGVDLEYGKNLLGAFHQPKLVMADTELLSTLPESEWKNGIGEGVKYACLAGGRIAEILAEGLNLNHTIDEFVALCVEYKAHVVAHDEKEGRLRKLLNLGHTVGHAVEKSSAYKTPHGVAVAYGVGVMAKSACAHGELSGTDYSKIEVLLKLYGFDNLHIPADISGAVANDKKAEGRDRISIVTIEGIGNCKIKNVSFEEFEKYINC